MKVKAKKESILKCLNVVSKALANKALIPIYDNILLDFRDNMCYAVCRDSTLQIEGTFGVESKDNFKMCIPAKTLLNTITLLDDEDIVFNYSEDKFTLNLSAKKKRYRITGVDPKNYNLGIVYNIFDPIKTMATNLVPFIKVANSIVDWNDQRPQLSGITIINSDNKMVVSGAHGGSVLFYIPTNIDCPEEFKSVILPREISMSIGSLTGKGECTLNISDKSLSMSMEGFRFFSTLLNAESPMVMSKYFNYDATKSITVNKNDVLMAAKRLRSFSSIDEPSIRLIIEGENITINTSNEEYGRDAEEIIDCKNIDIPDLSIKFSINKMIMTLMTIDSEDIRLHLTAKSMPMFITSTNTLDVPGHWAICPMT